MPAKVAITPSRKPRTKLRLAGRGGAAAIQQGGQKNSLAKEHRRRGQTQPPMVNSLGELSKEGRIMKETLCIQQLLRTGTWYFARSGFHLGGWHGRAVSRPLQSHIQRHRGDLLTANRACRYMPQTHFPGVLPQLPRLGTCAQLTALSPRPASSSVAISGSFGGGRMAFCFITLPAIPIRPPGSGGQSGHGVCGADEEWATWGADLTPGLE